MRHTRPVLIVIAALLLLAGGGAAVPGPAAADNACKVSLSATLNNTRPGQVRTTYTFGVAANSAESCADVAYALIVTEQLPDGTSKKTELDGDMRVRNQTRIEAVSFETDAKNKVKAFEAKMKSCTICEAP